MVRFLSGRMSFMVMYSMSAFSDLWTSVDGMLVLKSVSTPPLGLSARWTWYISYPWMGNLLAVEMGLLDAADINFFCALRNHWRSSLFCHTSSGFQCTMRSVWWLVALLCPPPAIRRGLELQSVSLVGPFWGWGPGTIPPWLRPTRMTPQQSRDNCMAIVSLIRRKLIFYPCQVGCVIRFRLLRFLLRVASSPRIAALPSWWVHPTWVCVLCFHCIDGLSFRTCEHHLPDCYDLQQGVDLFRLHSCRESQVLLFQLVCRWGWAI